MVASTDLIHLGGEFVKKTRVEEVGRFLIFGITEEKEKHFRRGWVCVCVCVCVSVSVGVRGEGDGRGQWIPG